MPRDATLLERAREMRQVASPAEQRLWLALWAGRLGGAKFRRQQVVGPYIVDLACRLPGMLIVEVDGDSHADQAAYDERRTAFLEQRGYRVVRFTNREVGENLEGVLTRIASALDLPLSPTLSPEGVRELKT